MAEKLDITKAYNELNETIEKGDHNQSLSICNKILAQYPTEKEVISSKIISLINLGKSDEAITFIKSNNSEKDNYLEYAYALYDTKKFKESIDVIINSDQKNDVMNILLAQNYYKLNEYEKSYEIYKKLIEEKINAEEIENETDLFTNYLACFAMDANNKDQEFLNGLKKYLSTWESYYNFCIIYLKNKDIENSFQLIKRVKEEYPKLEDEFNELKNLVMNLYNIQNIFEGFDLNKYTIINKKFESFFRNYERNQKNKDYIKMMPYFYVNFLNFKKDKDTNNEVIRKLEGFLKNKDISLSKEEEKIIIKNKINFLIRANKLKEAEDLLKEIKDDKEYNIYHGLILYKNEKEKDKAIQNIKEKIKSTDPQDDLFIIQLMLTSLTTKSMDEFHKTVMEFIKKNKKYCLSEYFISFFIGLYNAKKSPNCLKEFIQEYSDIEDLNKSIKDKTALKNIILLIAETFYKSNNYEKSAKFYQYYLDNVNKKDKDIQFLLIQSLVHFDINKADSIRRQIDETEIDLSNENINKLLNELFSKFKKGGEKQEKTKKKRKRKIRYPKNFDPKHPGPMPDPERWLPKMQKKKYRAKNKLAHQGAVEETKK